MSKIEPADGKITFYKLPSNGNNNYAANDTYMYHQT